MIRLAWRGLWQRKLRTVLTLIGVAACVLALTTMDGMTDYMYAEREREVARMAGRVLLQPHGAGYPPLKNALRAESVIAALDQPSVAADESTPLLFLILEPPATPMDIAGVIGVGLWPGHERAWLGTVGAVSGQATLVGEGDDAVILGHQAARFYGVSAAGETVTLAGHSWLVVGVLEELKTPNVDDLVVMPLASAQELVGAEEWISAVLLTAEEGQSESLALALADEYPTLKVNTQADIRRWVLDEMELPNNFMGTASWVALVIVVLTVANVMSIAVRERTQEVASIRAIGGKRSTILGYTLAEALTLSLCGGALGALIAVPVAHLFDWAWILSWREMLRVAGLVLAAGVLAGLYPAYRAARAYPQALRYDELRRQMEEVTAEKRAMDQAYRQQVQGREEERERLARELHDQAIQSLVGFKFHLAEKVPDAQASLQAEIDGVIGALRELCADLRPPALDRLGLVATLRAYANDLGARAELPVELRVEGQERRLPPEIELAFFRVAQEALANAWKHAQAPKVK
ncbi:MAG: FtsX-like permease family protein, partial [Anaerolineales bacterium]